MPPWHRKLRKALDSVKDHTTISLAKVASAYAPELEVALVKATSHEEVPFEEKHLIEVLHLTSFSRVHVSACVASLSKRLTKTHNWIVAIKVLMLIHRLLLHGNPAFDEELLLASRQGTRVLNMSNFRDDIHPNGWDFSAFIRTYALFLDELVDFNMGEKPPSHVSRSSNARSSGYDSHGSVCEEYGSGRFSEERVAGLSELPWRISATPIKDMTICELLQKVSSLQRLLERVLACQPSGVARASGMVQVALCPVIRESFQLYTDIRDSLAIILDAYFGMEHMDAVKAFEVYTEGAKQAEDLDVFYSSCKSIGLCKALEYPLVQKISEDLLETMDRFLRDCVERTQCGKLGASPEGWESTKKTLNGKSLQASHSPASGELQFEEENALSRSKNFSSPASRQPNLLKVETSSQGQQIDAILPHLNDDSLSIEPGNKLAIVVSSDNVLSMDRDWETFSSEVGERGVGMLVSLAATPASDERSVAGWELALLASPSHPPDNNILEGGCDQLILDRGYGQALCEQVLAASMPSASANITVLPAIAMSSSSLALPSPRSHGKEDPFAASLAIPPPPYVQIEDMRQKQQLLVQEQQEMWSQYQRNGMQGHPGLLKLYNNAYSAPLQTLYSVPYPGMSNT